MHGYDIARAICGKAREDHAKYYAKNKDKILENNRKNRKRKYKEDIQFNLNIKTRRRIWSALKYAGAKKSEKTIDLLGCSFEEYKEYIESLFVDGMGWDNVSSGEIHIDHIIPICSFDLTNPKELAMAFNYKNTQPLWAIDNFRKSGNITQDIMVCPIVGE